jgi:hypothetical protein
MASQTLLAKLIINHVLNTVTDEYAMFSISTKARAPSFGFESF